MFDKLFELIYNIWHDLVPYFVVSQMESACVLRFGKFHSVKKSGIHLKIPFFDKVYQNYIVTRTSHLSPQTLTTCDDKSIVVKAIVRFHIEDIKLYTLEVWDAHDAIGDTVQGVINNIVKKLTWTEIISGIEEEATLCSQELLINWGIKIERIILSDIGLIRTIRLINANII